MNENIVSLLNSAQNILICVSKNAKLDSIASALALTLAISQQGKSVKVCSETDTKEASRLPGSDKISNKLDLGGDILKVSFPYKEGALDKVTYNITDNNFNLLIEPRKGQAPLSSEGVKFSHTGGNVDLIITVDTPNLESLGDIYFENPDIFDREKIINIDRRFDNKKYGVENIIEKQFSSTSEIILNLIDTLRWNINPDIATNLYSGLISATNNFSSFSTNAQTFEAASFLVKNGAKKLAVTAPGVQTPPVRNMPSFNQRYTNPSSFNTPAVPSFGNQEDAYQNQPIYSNTINQIPPQSEENKPQAKPEQQTQQVKPEIPDTEKKKPPKDWLKPKIFKSSDVV
jgi:hypothetical protein